jgi:lysophospholipase L1-like esterase
MPSLARRHRPLLAAAAAALAAIPLAACSASSPAASPASSPAFSPASSPGFSPGFSPRAGGYVALGDSYTAGPDIPDQAGQPAGCQRSSRSYPYLVARALGLAAGQVRDMSCAGATTRELTTAQRTSDGTNPAQLSALSATTTLVTVGIGGNDIGFGPALTRCAELDLLPVLISKGSSAMTPCQDYYTSVGAADLQQRIQDAGSGLAAALAAIKARAPEARVYVIGYPELLPASASAGCSLSLGITPGDLAFINQQEQRLNQTLHERAAAAGAGYVDTYAPSAGHDACTAPAVRWAEPLLPSSPAAPLHPNATGEQQMAQAVVKAIRGDG